VRQEGSSGNLYHVRARYYDATTARFISKEPIWPVPAKPLELNPYQYAHLNPVTFADVTGLGLANDLWKYTEDGWSMETPITTPPSGGGVQDMANYGRDAANDSSDEWWSRQSGLLSLREILLKLYCAMYTPTVGLPPLTGLGSPNTAKEELDRQNAEIEAHATAFTDDPYNEKKFSAGPIESLEERAARQYREYWGLDKSGNPIPSLVRDPGAVSVQYIDNK
jgi:RHS repeat-associated protein